MSNPRPNPPLRPHTPASVSRPGAVRPGVKSRPGPGRRPGPGGRPSGKRPGPAPEAPDRPTSAGESAQSTAKVRTRRPRSHGPAARGGRPRTDGRIPAHAGAKPAPRALPARAGEPAPEAPAPRGPSLADQLGQKVYVADLQTVPHDDLAIEPNKTCFFDTINKVKALTVAGPTNLCIDEDLARARGYEPEDLMAIAEIAWHYLMSGGLRLALTLYEGLTAVAPDEPYFALALGLTFDRMNDPRQADAWYRKASQLDPKDGRPDINRAELCLEAGDKAKATKLLARGSAKAAAAGDLALARKADALLDHLMKR